MIFERNRFFPARKHATKCHWCENPALRQEIDARTKQFIGACKDHLEKLKTVTAERQRCLNEEAKARHEDVLEQYRIKDKKAYRKK